MSGAREPDDRAGHSQKDQSVAARPVAGGGGRQGNLAAPVLRMRISGTPSSDRLVPSATKPDFR